MSLPFTVKQARLESSNTVRNYAHL